MLLRADVLALPLSHPAQQSQGDEDLVSRVLRTSECTSEWIVWPVEGFLGPQRGPVELFEEVKFAGGVVGCIPGELVAKRVQ